MRKFRRNGPVINNNNYRCSNHGAFCFTNCKESYKTIRVSDFLEHLVNCNIERDERMVSVMCWWSREATLQNEGFEENSSFFVNKWNL